MHAFLLALVPYVTHPAFLATVSGIFAPFLHWFLRELGLNLTDRQNFWFNAFLSATPFLAMVTVWGAHGLPQAAELYTSIGLSVAASQALYKTLVRNWMDGKGEQVETTAPEATGDA